MVSDGTSPVTTTYVLDTATPLTMVLSESTGTETVRYWHGLDTLAQSDGTSVEYFGYDGLGSVRQLVDASGSVGLAQTFDPYGNGYAKAGSAQSALGYTGEQTDSNGFVFLRARYYQPGMGRFTQMDPSRQEKNVYQYAAGNPVMFIDLSGLDAKPYLPAGVTASCEGRLCYRRGMTGIRPIPLFNSNHTPFPGHQYDFYGMNTQYALWLNSSQRRELAAELANELAPKDRFFFENVLGLWQSHKTDLPQICDADGKCVPDPDGEPYCANTDCAIFASYILWRAGFQMSGQKQAIEGGWQHRNTEADTDNTNIWYANFFANSKGRNEGRNASWENVEHLYNYWLSKGAIPVEEEQLRYTLDKGDLLFYDYHPEDPPDKPYDHVAIVVDNEYLAQLSQVNPGSPKFRRILSSEAYKIYISHRGQCPSGGSARADYNDKDTTGWHSLYRDEFGLKMPY